VALVAVRLSDVAPDDKATWVTYGLLNLTQRDGSEAAEALEPDTRYRVEGTLNHIGHVFPAGNRLRVSTSYWPLAWPAPQPARVTIHTGGSELVLPECLRRDAELDAYEGEGEGEQRVFSENGDYEIPRDFN